MDSHPILDTSGLQNPDESLATEILLIVGVSTFLGFTLGATLHLDAKIVEWAYFILVGLLVSAFVFLRKGAFFQSFLSKKIVLSSCVAFLGFTFFYLSQNYDFYFPLGFAAVQSVLFFYSSTTRPTRKIRKLELFFQFLLFNFFWFCAFRMVYAHHLSQFFQGEKLLRLIEITMFLFAWDWVRSKKSSVLTFCRTSPVVLICSNIISYIVLFVFCFRKVWNEGHWSFMLASLEIFKQGGTFWWDIPSQYGMLNFLLTGLLPTHSILNSLYLMNSLCIFISALIYYFFCCQLMEGVTGRILALLVTLSSICFLPGAVFSPSALFGPNFLPSVGAFRFIWVYVLIAFLTWGARRELQVQREKAYEAFGTAIWLIGSFWSIESFAYVSAIWVSYVGLNKALEAQNSTLLARVWAGTSALVFKIFVPALIVLTLVSAYYWSSVKSFPDLRCFYEFGRFYSTGMFSLHFKKNGTIWTLLGLIIILLSLWNSGTRKSFSLERKNFVLLVSFFGGFMGTATYFFGRSHDNNILNLYPVFTLIVMAGLVAVSQQRKLHFQYYLPFVILSLSITWSQAASLKSSVGNFFNVSMNQFPQNDLNSGCSSEAKLLIAQLDKRPFSSSEKIYYLATTELDFSTCNPNARELVFIPVNGLLAMLPIERWQTYVKRYLARHPIEGYLLVDHRVPLPENVTELSSTALLNHYFELGSETVDGDWSLRQVRSKKF